MHQYGIWIKEAVSTVGTGVLTLTGAINGYTTFNSQVNVGETVVYSIEDNGADRELGIGTLIAADTLERTIVRAKLVGGVFTANPSAPLNLSGKAEVACTTDAVLLEWAEGIRESTGHDGEVVAVDPSGLAVLTGELDGGVIP